MLVINLTALKFQSQEKKRTRAKSLRRQIRIAEIKYKLDKIMKRLAQKKQIMESGYHLCDQYSKAKEYFERLLNRIL